MSKIIELMKKDFSKKIILILFVFLAITGKIVRYTVMRENLVYNGVGFIMLESMNEGNLSFGLTINDYNVESYINACDNSTFLFNLINFFNLDTYGEFEIYISIIWNIILFALLLKINKRVSLFQIIFISISIIVINIFDFCLAKEPIQILYFIAMYFVIISKIKSEKLKYILCLGIVMFCTLTFRIYYILICMFMVVIGLIFKFYFSKLNKIRKRDILISIIILSLIYCIALFALKFIATSEYEELLRVRLRISDATSDIRTIFNSSNLILFFADYLLIAVRMLFPIELIRLGPKYLLYVIYQLIITYIVIKNVWQYKEINQNKKIALCIFVAFLMCSAAFEPDFGSWIRHEATVFPILMILSGVKDEQKE